MNKKIMQKMGFAEDVDKVEKGICPRCDKKVNKKEFRDFLSMKEFSISGLCQECQDEIFGKD